MNANLARLAIALAAACCASAATAQDFDAITIRFRSPYGICAGVCPHFEMEVDNAGHVLTRHLTGDATYRFRATPRDLERFKELLDEVRPSEDRRIDNKCEQAKLEDGSPDPLSSPRADDIEVRWYTATGFTRLTACAGNGPLRTALQDALRALGADPFFGMKAGEDP